MVCFFMNIHEYTGEKLKLHTQGTYNHKFSTGLPLQAEYGKKKGKTTTDIKKFTCPRFIPTRQDERNLHALALLHFFPDNFKMRVI